MTGLGNLIKLQKLGTQGPAPAKPQSPSEPTHAEPTTASAQHAPAPKPLGLMKGLGGLKAPAKPAIAEPAAPKVVDELPDSFSLEDLAAFDAGSVNESRPRHEGASEFLDEVEATAPDRDLPGDISSAQMAFIESLDNVYPVLHDPDMLGQAVRMVMLELQENPEYIKLVSDHDVHTMIRGMRNTMGMARIRKQEKSRKVGAGTKANARAKSKLTDSDLALLDAAMGGDWGD